MASGACGSINGSGPVIAGGMLFCNSGYPACPSCPETCCSHLVWMHPRRVLRFRHCRSEMIGASGAAGGDQDEVCAIAGLNKIKDRVK